MKITDIECFYLKIPKVSTNIIGGRNKYEGYPYRDKSMEEIKSMVGTSAHFGYSLSCLVKVHTDEGIIGIGEAGGGRPYVVDKIKENIIGTDVFDITHICNRQMEGLGSSPKNPLKHKGLPRTKEMSAIEFALWDCIGKKLKQPVYKLMGGKVREKVAISLFLGERPIDECIKDIDKAIKQGINTVKLKVGLNDRRDIDLFREVRRQFGYELIVRIDPNGAWTVPEGVRVLKQMGKFNPQYVEGALRRIEAYGFRRLREMTGIPVCICEQFNGYYEMNTEEALLRIVELMRMKACDVLSIDPSRVGGLLGFAKACALCEGAGISVVTHRALTGPSHAAWLTGCIVNYATEYAQDIVPVGQPSGPLYDSVYETLPIENGYMKPWDLPGWGMTINEDIINKYGISYKDCVTPFDFNDKPSGMRNK